MNKSIRISQYSYQILSLVDLLNLTAFYLLDNNGDSVGVLLADFITLLLALILIFYLACFFRNIILFFNSSSFNVIFLPKVWSSLNCHFMFSCFFLIF